MAEEAKPKPAKTSQIMSSKKPEATKQAVVSKRLQGVSKRKISRDLNIDRETVDNILDESNVEAALAGWRRA